MAAPLPGNSNSQPPAFGQAIAAIPSAQPIDLGGSSGSASSIPFCPAFDAWESINRYIDECSKGVRQGVVKE